MTTYFYLNYLRGELVPFDIAPVPHFGQPVMMLLNIGLAVNRHSRVKEAELQLVDFLTSLEAQQFVRQHTYSIPARKQAAEWSGEELLYRPSRFSLPGDDPRIPLFQRSRSPGHRTGESERRSQTILGRVGDGRKVGPADRECCRPSRTAAEYPELSNLPNFI